MTEPRIPPEHRARKNRGRAAIGLVRTSGRGLRARPARVVLAAFWIAVGVAAATAAAGISSSSRAAHDALLDRLGTTLLTVTAGQAPGQAPGDERPHLPRESDSMIDQIEQVESATAAGRSAGVHAYRNDRIEQADAPDAAGAGAGVAVLAARTDLPAVVGATVDQGSWFGDGTDGTGRLPVVVLGAAAAGRLGLARDGVDAQVWLEDRRLRDRDPPKVEQSWFPAPPDDGGDLAAPPEATVSGSSGEGWFTVVGILAPVPLAPELDDAAFVGWPVAEDRLGFDGYPTVVYARVAEHAVDDVLDVLARTADPRHPGEVQASRPSDVVEAAYAADGVPTGILFGLGVVALGVGGVAVAATTAVSVLERRGEIGLRRALGATRGQIRAQFLAEAVLLSLVGGTAGVLLGAGIVAGYSAVQGWPAVIPVGASVGAVIAAGVVGAVAALHPATRAARLTPAEALAAP